MKNSRNQIIELGRILSAFGIVAFHRKVVGSPVFYSGLLFFIFLTSYMECRVNWSRFRSIKSRVEIFLVPWLFWMVVYGLMNVLVGNPLFPKGTTLGRILGGTSLHLWFMPAMFVCLVAFNYLKKYSSEPVVFYGSLLILLVFVAALPFVGNSLSALSAPYYHWLHALPALLVGVIFGLIRDSKARMICAISAAGLFLIFAMLDQPHYFSVTYPVGCLLIAVFILLPEKVRIPSIDIQKIADCTLGVYLSHIVFVRVFNAVIGREMLLIAIVAFLASLTFVLFARKYFPASKHVLG